MKAATSTSSRDKSLNKLGEIEVELDKKYVFHIPLYKYVDNELIALDMDDIIDELIMQFSEKGYDSLYMSMVKGYYKTRCFDEIIITLYVSSEFLEKHEFPESIFKEWFRKNNELLGQEEFAYECGNKMHIEKLTHSQS